MSDAPPIEQPIPLSTERTAYLIAPRPMTVEEWAMLERTLTLWKPLWIEEKSQEASHD